MDGSGSLPPIDHSGHSWHYLNAIRLDNDTFVWDHGQCPPPTEYDEDNVFVFRIIGIPNIRGAGGSRPKAIAEINELFERNGISCIQPLATGYWRIDFDEVVQHCPNGRPFDWLTGQVELIDSPIWDDATKGMALEFTISETRMEKRTMGDNVVDVPASIRESYDKFRVDNPDPAQAAFIMMRFGDTPAHASIVKAIRDVLKKFGIVGLRADDKQYHDDLFPNVQTYLHGCGFGIAIFERIENNEFNPNVGLEVGYLLAMGKPVCYLKDKSLAALHTDLIGKLYRTFDTYQPLETIPKELEAWLSDKGLAKKRQGDGGGSAVVIIGH